MFSNLSQLIDLLDIELTDRNYGIRKKELAQGWNKLSQWMRNHGFEEFSEEVGIKFCDENLGSHLLRDGMSNQERILLRAVRLLISYQKTGDIEFRSPKVERSFIGEIGKPFTCYISYIKNDLRLSISTVNNKVFYLHAFYNYIREHSLTLENLNMTIFEEFFAAMGYTLASRHNCGSTLRIFLRYALDSGLTAKDMSVYVLPDNYKHYCKLPTTYEESEIKKIITMVDRASPTGKRDYIILLLAAEYGWRSKDIVSFRFDQIDWDKNVISFVQSKTGVPVEYPLLASVGNAIIDYMKNGRPNTESDVVIVSNETAKKGRPLSPPTVHSIVTRYMRKANIKDWAKKKHGAHSLRHSLASNMLKKNISMPIISTVIGHQRTETTKIYLSIDIEKLKLCTLTMPTLSSPYYRTEAI